MRIGPQLRLSSHRAPIAGSSALAALALVAILLFSAFVLGEHGVPLPTSAADRVAAGGGTAELRSSAVVGGHGSLRASLPAATGTKYPVWFNETGLGSGGRWQAWLNSTDGGSHGGMTGMAKSFEFNVLNDTYSYQIYALTAGYTISPSLATGNLTVAGTWQTVNVTINETLFRVRVSETGLPAGISWRATLGGVSKRTTSTLITFEVPNGTYAYSIGTITGYSVKPQYGNVTVGGGNLTVALVFSPNAAAPESFLATWWWAVLGVVVILVVAVVLLVRRQRSRSPPATWQPPTGTPPAPPPPPASPPPSGGAGSS
jgi:hypothetical protein